MVGNALANLGAVALRCRDYEDARVAAEEALAIADRIGESENVLWMLIPRDVLAESLMRLGRLDQAEALYHANLRGMYALRETDDSELAWAFGMLAGLAVARGDFVRAARLAGAEERMLANIEEVRDGHRRELSEELYLGPLRPRAGDSELESAWEEGRALSLEAGVDYALGASLTLTQRSAENRHDRRSRERPAAIEPPVRRTKGRGCRRRAPCG